MPFHYHRYEIFTNMTIQLFYRNKDDQKTVDPTSYTKADTH